MGETYADWFDSKIEKARLGAQRDASNWIWNAAVNTLADLASIAPDVLRFGKGIGCALFNDQASGYDRAWAIARDVGRGLTLPGVGIAARAAFRAAKGVGKAVSKARPPRGIRRSLKDQADDLVPRNANKHRVTLRSPSQKMDVDLAGVSHRGIPTPHTRVSPRNPRAPNQPAYNTSDSKSVLRESTQQDIRTVRRYLKRQNR